MTWPALDAQLLADSAATFNFRLGLPTPLAVTADGAVLFRRTPPRDVRRRPVRARRQDRRGQDARDRRRAARRRRRAPVAMPRRRARERTRTATRGVVDIDVSDDGQIVLVPLGGTFYLIDRATGGAPRDRSEGRRVRPAPVARRHADRVRARRRSVGRSARPARREAADEAPRGLRVRRRRVRRAGGARSPARVLVVARQQAAAVPAHRRCARSRRSTSPTRATRRSRRCRSSIRAPARRTRSSTSAIDRRARAASRSG